jgi:energy-coupling factor transport system permease protein
MQNNITLGQYFPMNSPVHRLDARFKLFLTIFFIVTVFFADGLLSYCLVTLVLGGVIAMSKIPFSMILKSLKPLIIIILFTAILNIFYTKGTPLVSFWIFKITYEGIVVAFKMGIRIILLVAGSSLLTYTTSPIMLTDAMEALLSPLKVFKVPVNELAMMMRIALRFIPTLMEETQKIMNAQKARGADFETGSLISRAKALVPILVPLFVSAFRRADDLAMAMESRCYTGGDNRTRLKPLVATGSDFVILVGCILVFSGIIVLGCFGL